MMDGKLCVVTGANTGIGKEVAAGLMAQGAEVIMACRSMPKCEESKHELEARRLPGCCRCAELDLSSFSSVRSFAKRLDQQLHAANRRLAVLVNNAGVMAVPPDLEGKDGHLKPNHFGPFLLTNLLIPLLARPSRIVNVGSRAHYQGSIQIKDGRIVEQPSNWYFQYARSKLCNLLFTAELQRRFAVNQVPITTYCVSPGRVNTNILHGIPWYLSMALQPVKQWIFQTPAQGSRTVLYAATSPEVEGVSELYLHHMAPAQPSAAAKDPLLARQLWDISSQEVGLTPKEMPVELQLPGSTL